MYTILILFFISLAGMGVMLGRKVFLLKKQNALNLENPDFEIPLPEWHEVKNNLEYNTKKYGYKMTVALVRGTVKTSIFLNKKGTEFAQKSKKIISQYMPYGTPKTITNKEVSGFLKIVSEYKHKIGKIKKQVIQEESLKDL